jgi:hypothetical protein
MNAPSLQWLRSALVFQYHAGDFCGLCPLHPGSQALQLMFITRRFEKDADAKAQLDKTVRLESVKQEDYGAVFYPGGHGPMSDLAEDKKLDQADRILPWRRQAHRACRPRAGGAAPCQQSRRQAACRGKNVTGFTRR